MPLPNAPLRAFAADTYAQLAGWAELGGLLDQLEEAVAPHAWNHPWLGLEVELPNGRGRITRCINHPYGEFLFDVEYPDPVPPINRGKIVLAENEAYHQMTHRYRAEELKELAK